MATFPSIDPNFGISKKSAPQIKATQFNNGYQQRLKWGMNIDPKVWTPTWENITEADSDTIEAFLVARADDSASFDWTPPNESGASKFICNGWDKTMNYAGLATITATFQQVFEP